MNYGELRRNIAPALRWAMDDMRSSKGRSWRWHECSPDLAWWATRQLGAAVIPAKDTLPESRWSVWAVGVVMPRRDPELAAVALGEVTRRVEQSALAGDQGGCVEYGVPTWGHMSTSVYCERVVIGMEAVYIHVAVASLFLCPPEGGGR